MRLLHLVQGLHCCLTPATASHRTPEQSRQKNSSGCVPNHAAHNAALLQQQHRRPNALFSSMDLAAPCGRSGCCSNCMGLTGVSRTHMRAPQATKRFTSESRRIKRGARLLLLQPPTLKLALLHQQPCLDRVCMIDHSLLGLHRHRRCLSPCTGEYLGSRLPSSLQQPSVPGSTFCCCPLPATYVLQQHCALALADRANAA